MNKEDIKKLKEHYEKQVILSYVLNDVKHYKEHLLILEVLDENESLKEIEEEHRKINGELRKENKQLKEELSKYQIMIAKFKDLKTLINTLNEKNFKYSFEEILKGED